MVYLSFFLLFFVPSFVYGVTNSSVSSINKDPCHYCNIDLNCHYTDLGNAVKSLESKVESLIKQNNKSFGIGIGDAIKSLEAKVESRTVLNKKTSCVGEAVKTLEAKVESLLELKNKTAGIADAVMSLDAKVEGFTALNNKTFGVADVLKSVEVKMENLNGLDNKTSGISKTVKTLEEKIESLSELRNKTSRIGDAVKSLEAKVENLIALINRASFIPPPVPIPTECQNYQSLTAADRKITYTTYHGYCDNSITEGWYRFEGAAGTRMPTSCMPSGNRCGTHVIGWLTNGHPRVADGRVKKQVCFSYNGQCCFSNFSKNIYVTNCGSYYVYQLVRPGNCYYRYCGTD